MQNYTDNANEDLPLTVENVSYFQFPNIFKMRMCSFGKKTDQLVSL